MSEFEKQVGDAADYVLGKIDRIVDSAGDVLSGESGKKVAGGAAVGALAAVVLPVSLVGGALLGAGYAALRHYGKSGGEAEPVSKGPEASESAAYPPQGQ